MMNNPTPRAALAYFAIVFAAGACFGPIRELVLTPRLGPVAAVLVETPFMLAASFFAARWTLRKWRELSTPWLAVWALAFLMFAEVGGSLWLRGMTPAQYMAHLASPPGLLSLALFAAFALMPAAIRFFRLDAPRRD